MKFSGAKVNGNGGIHKPSGQWMTVSSPRSSIFLDGQEDLDEAKEVFRRVREPTLRMLQPCVREANVRMEKSNTISGAMKEMSRKVRKASTHMLQCQYNTDITSTRTKAGQFKGGAGRKVREGSEGRRTPPPVASFWYMFESISVALLREETRTPPPCQEERECA